MIIEKVKKEKYIEYLDEHLKPKVFELLDTIGKNGQLEEKFINQVIFIPKVNNFRFSFLILSNNGFISQGKIKI